jgi:hypothetical protein
MIPLVCLLIAAGADVTVASRQVAASAQVLQFGVTPSERVAPPAWIAPGPPPLLSFRYYEAQQRHRYSNTELTLDDAGH